jgi:hypothetical protein
LHEIIVTHFDIKSIQQNQHGYRNKFIYRFMAHRAWYALAAGRFFPAVLFAGFALEEWPRVVAAG